MRSRGTLWAYTSARTKRNLAFLWAVLFLCSLLLQSVSLAAPAATLAASGLKAGTVQGFEIDGDLASGNGASNPGAIPAELIDALSNGDDWLDGASGNGVVDPENPPRSDLITDPAGVANDDQFIGGAKELDTCTWGFDQGPVTGKDDFRHIMAYAKFVGNSAFFYVGAERIVNNGDTHIDFELNRMAWTVFPGAGGVAKPNRSVGDLILSLEFANGGSNPEMTVYRIATVTDCLSGGQKAGEEVTVQDITTTAAVHSATNFVDTAALGNTIEEFMFAEASIDLASLGIQTSCPGFSAGSVRSRAGGDIDSSQLKDTADPFPIDLNNCGRIIVEKQTNPDGSTQSFHFDASFDDDGFNLTDGQQHNSGNLEPGTYSVSEDLPDNWQLLSAECDDDSDPGSIQLGANEVVTCLFRNKFLAAEMGITKTPDGQNKNAGESISFTLTWSNTGEGFATGVVVTDNLPDPAGVEWSLSNPVGSGSTCVLGGTPADQTLTCDVGTLAAGASGSITLTSATTPESCGVIDNTASVTTTNDGSDTDPGQITVRCPDVTVVKTPDEPNNDINAGDPATFGIVVKNLGPGTATGVTLSDQLPAGTWTLGGPDAGDCSISAGNLLTCSFGTLAADETRSITVTRPTTGADCSSIDNTATVAATNEPASNTGNNSDPGEIDSLCGAVSIDKTANPAGPVNAGEPIGFDIVVTNHGAGFLTGVTVLDTLPAGFSWSEDSADCSINANLLTCSFGTITAGGTRSVHLSSPTDPADCGVVENTASVTTTNDGSGSDSASVTILCPDVTVQKTADDSPILAGETGSYTITVRNIGDGLAENVTLNDTLPAGVEWSEDSEACSITGGILSCVFGDLAAGASAAVHVSGVTDIEDCGQLPNIATVAATNEAAEDQDNNIDGDTIVVQCASISIVKTAGDAADGAEYVTAPDDVTFTYVVTNTSSATLINVAIVDDNATPADDGDDFAVTCPKTTLAAGESMTCTATAPVSFGIRTNVAVVTANPQVAPEAQVTDQDDAVVRVPQLTIDKSFTGNTKGTDPILGLPAAKEGDVLTYTLQYDLSDGPVTNGVITDVLPAGLAYVDGSALGNDEFGFTSFTPATRTLRWDAASVSKDGAVTYQVVVQAGANELPQPLINVATIDSDETEPDDDDAKVVVPGEVLVATPTPRITPPPTDSLTDVPSNPGFGLMLAVLFLGGLTLAVGFLTPAPAPARSRRDRR